MALDLVSLADASQLLGVSPERVRQLVVAGDLPGVRFGNAWAVPRDAVAARRQVSNRRGRPLGERRAWQAIGSGDVDLSNVSRYRNRGLVERYSMSPADAAYLVSDLGAVESGVAGAVFHGELLQAEGAELDLYVSQRVHERLASVVAAVADPLGSVVLRVVSDESWPDAEALAARSDEGRLVAPAAAVALDLMDSGDARHWVAAENLVRAYG
ncbi:MAG: helix-turn-helix domain-containing protein [Acidimicrobiales bacterium]